MSAITWERDVFTEGPEEIAIRQGLVVTRIAGGALMLTGLLHGASLLQTAMFGHQSFPIVLGELVFVTLCLVHVFAGSRAYDGSVFFAGLGAAAGFGGAGFAAMWFGLLLSWGVLALLPLLAVVVGGLCGLVCVAAVPFAVRVSAARRQLVEG